MNIDKNNAINVEYVAPMVELVEVATEKASLQSTSSLEDYGDNPIFG